MGNSNSSQAVAALKVAARSKSKSKKLDSESPAVPAAPAAVPEKAKATDPTTSTSTTLASPPARAWWKESSVYQVYPSSFYDSNGDGIGDIVGIIEKLDYLKLLGVDIVWLSPVYKSPQFDMGYDISDYRDIHPPYGTMEDLDRLIDGVHQRGMKFVMDLVVNHTSDQHEWFQESKSSLDNPKRDWYIWRDPAYDQDGNRQAPNNWASIFGGSSWTFDEKTGQYYLHLFCKEQPDLNWENPDVVKAVHDIMRFWLDKGTDGFRMDVINLVSKTPGLPDAPITFADQKYQPADVHYAFGPRLHEHLRELRKILDEYDAYAVGEMPWVKEQNHVLETVSASRKELNMIFQFDIVDMDIGAGGKFTTKKWALKDLKAIVGKWQTSMYDAGGWNALFVENHDQPRSVTRWACDEPQFRAAAAKMLATFVGLQSGTPYIYQGQELGMANSPMHWERKEYKDIETQNMWTSALERFGDDKELMDEFYQELHLKARDHSRTPLQWNKQKHAGFSTGTPWMRVNDDYTEWNAEQQIPDPNSVFVYWQNILKLRKHQKNIFVYGSFEMIDNEHESVFAYRRSYESSSATIVLNFSKTETNWVAPGRVLESLAKGDLVLHSHQLKGRVEASKELPLRPFEALVWVNGSYV